VYDFHGLPTRTRLDEQSPLEPHPADRDAYTEAKLLQERLVRRWCEARAVPCVVVRPGAIIGPGKTWAYGAAFALGRFAFVVSPRAPFRLVSRANCADAIVKAVGLDGDGTCVINVVDDRLPTHAELFRCYAAAGATHRIMVPVPWRALEAVGRLVRFINTRTLGGRLRTPELFDHRRQHARWKPLSYPNDAAHRILGWQSTQTVERAVRDSIGRDVPAVDSTPSPEGAHPRTTR
jgi:nucleoside-diphosphate-sugar epimerase